MPFSSVANLFTEMQKRHTTASLGLPPLTIDPELDKYVGKMLFPEKVAEMDESLSRVGLPQRQTSPAPKTKTSVRPARPASSRPKKAA